MSSPVNDVRKLRTNSAASAAEMIEWLQRMRGKSPREVLGSVADSGLLKSFIQSAFLIALVVFGWTAAVWGWETWRGEKSESVAGEETPAAPDKANQENPKPVVPDNVANPNTAEMPDLDLNSKQKVADKLGIGETKTAPANSNPLDSNDDDLLKGLE